MLNDAFTWSEQQYNIKKVEKREKEKWYSAVADIFAWLPIFGIVSRITLEQFLVIADALAITSLIIFLILLLIAVSSIFIYGKFEAYYFNIDILNCYP